MNEQDFLALRNKVSKLDREVQKSLDKQGIKFRILISSIEEIRYDSSSSTPNNNKSNPVR